MISSVAFNSAGTTVTITTADGATWFDDASLPADTDLRRQLVDWLALGNTIMPYTEPVLTIEEQLAAIEASFNVKKAALATRLTTVILIDGASETDSRLAINAEYVTICDEKQAAIDALIFGV